MKSLCLVATALFVITASALHADTSLLITADSTLRPVIPELTQAWADKQPDTTVELQFTNAETIQKQLVDGKAGDVIILVDGGDLKEAAKRGYVNAAEQKQVARNDLIVYGRKPVLADEELDWFDLVAREWETLALGDPARTSSGRAILAALDKHGLAPRAKEGKTRLCGNEVVALDCARRSEVEAVFLMRTDLGKTTIDGFTIFPIDRADYPGIFYIAVPTSKTKALVAARSYIQMLAAKESLPVWEKYGYNQPASGTVQLRPAQP